MTYYYIIALAGNVTMPSVFVANDIITYAIC